MDLITKITSKQLKPNLEEFRVGDTVIVGCKIIERKNTDAGVFLTLECNSKDYKKYLDHVWVDKN